MDQPDLIVSGKWLDMLKKAITDHDYCFLCDNHPSHGHDKDCPLKGFGEIDDSGTT